jgi:hypothetical protein
MKIYLVISRTFSDDTDQTRAICTTPEKAKEIRDQIFTDWEMENPEEIWVKTLIAVDGQFVNEQ